MNGDEVADKPVPKCPKIGQNKPVPKCPKCGRRRAGKKDKMYGILLCLYSGLRIGELMALQWSDIDLAKGILTVSKSCHDGKGGFVRYDKQSEELCVCTERYSDDIRSDGWGILKELWG